MQSLLKFAIVPALFLGLLACDTKSAKAQFGISLGVGGPGIHTGGFGYGYGVPRYGASVYRSSLYSPYGIGVPSVGYRSYSRSYQSFGAPVVRSHYYAPRSSFYRQPAVVVPRVSYGRRCF
ncbi:MAG: hypothetical protein Aurels2KO_41970 [Aureliella sp.]